MKECEGGVCELPMTREDKVADYLWATDIISKGTTIRQAELGQIMPLAMWLRNAVDQVVDMSVAVGVMHQADVAGKPESYNDLVVALAELQYKISDMAVMLDVNLEEAFSRVHTNLMASVPHSKEYEAPDMSDLIR